MTGIALVIACITEKGETGLFHVDTVSFREKKRGKDKWVKIIEWLFVLDDFRRIVNSVKFPDKIKND